MEYLCKKTLFFSLLMVLTMNVSFNASARTAIIVVDKLVTAVSPVFQSGYIGLGFTMLEDPTIIESGMFDDNNYLDSIIKRWKEQKPDFITCKHITLIRHSRCILKFQFTQTPLNNSRGTAAIIYMIPLMYIISFEKVSTHVAPFKWWFILISYLVGGTSDTLTKIMDRIRRQKLRSTIIIVAGGGT